MGMVKPGTTTLVRKPLDHLAVDELDFLGARHFLVEALPPLRLVTQAPVDHLRVIKEAGRARSASRFTGAATC